jgi:hydrogenase-4 component E
MLILHLEPVASSLFSLLAITSLLLSFVMLGSRWLKNYLYALAAQSWIIALLSALSACYSGHAELYFISALTLLFRGIILPYFIWRIIRGLDVDREIHEILQPSSALVIGALFVMFALAVSVRLADQLYVNQTVAELALTVMLSMNLIGLLMLAIRREVVSQILGLLLVENGIRLGAQILVPGMPLLLELVILFDLLVIVVCFGVLVSYLRTHAGTTSALGLKRLVG